MKLVLEIVIRFDDGDDFCAAPLAVAAVAAVVAVAAIDCKLACAIADAILFDVVIDDAEVVN